MFAWVNLVLFVERLLESFLQLYFWVVIVSAVMSWIEPNPYNPVVRFIYSVTEPVFDWVRRRLPVFFGGLDFSPWVVVLAIMFLQSYLIPTVSRIAISGFN